MTSAQELFLGFIKKNNFLFLYSYSRCVFYFPFTFGTSTCAPQLIICVVTKELKQSKYVLKKIENGIEPFRGIELRDIIVEKEIRRNRSVECVAESNRI
jgi:hypothetical protein